jgi:hypothetical protein
MSGRPIPLLPPRDLQARPHTGPGFVATEASGPSAAASDVEAAPSTPGSHVGDDRRIRGAHDVGVPVAVWEPAVWRAEAGIHRTQLDPRPCRALPAGPADAAAASFSSAGVRDGHGDGPWASSSGSGRGGPGADRVHFYEILERLRPIDSTKVPDTALADLERACDQKVAIACYAAARLHARATASNADPARETPFMTAACAGTAPKQASAGTKDDTLEIACAEFSAGDTAH